MLYQLKSVTGHRLAPAATIKRAVTFLVIEAKAIFTTAPRAGLMPVA
jgi:hypothetical protein